MCIIQQLSVSLLLVLCVEFHFISIYSGISLLSNRGVSDESVLSINLSFHL